MLKVVLTADLMLEFAIFTESASALQVKLADNHRITKKVFYLLYLRY